MLKVCRIFRFEAAHNLPNHSGKCQFLHGHSYKLEVEVVGGFHQSGPETGMVIDFQKLDSTVKMFVVNKYDHNLLNEFYENPTAEIMVYKIVELLDEPFKNLGVKLLRVRLWETENSYAEWEYVD